MLALFTILLLVLLFSGLPVAFSLGLGGIAGMVLFLGGMARWRRCPSSGTSRWMTSSSCPYRCTSS